MTPLLVRALTFAGSALISWARSCLPSWLVGSASQHSHGSSRWARTADRQGLGRSAHAERLTGDGIVLGFVNGRALQSPAEDNVLLMGVQRSGKTSSVVVPTLLTWTGPAIATSTKEELINLTLDQRRRLGPVWVFAPLDEDRSWLGRLGLDNSTWNPVEAASSSGAAAELADHFTADGKRGHNAHWYLAASSLISGLVICERERGGDMRSVLERASTAPLPPSMSASRGLWRTAPPPSCCSLTP